MSNRGEALGQAHARSDGPPQPALDPLLAHFSAMGMAQVHCSVRPFLSWSSRWSQEAALHGVELSCRDSSCTSFDAVGCIRHGWLSWKSCMKR